ncbi:hypothetical protein BP00DRAFT_447386 [Aspergillus indologenus CBS 114.80]|uniref:Uncharacterized protein n=1 Tax=Aspergillus indologenus CBS 114.80 TaxID=1450541 RepID=A0A2V5I1B6_9EURO|nr:hypothetical protein BP00DRAFT_447386 [Aspergillus indologenus CBS 114.80]
MDKAKADQEGVPPSVIIELLCCDPRRETPVIVRMYCQIPHTGMERKPASQRATQATDAVCPQATECLATSKKLAEVKCEHSPVLIGSAQTKQGPWGWVPAAISSISDLPLLLREEKLFSWRVP